MIYRLNHLEELDQLPCPLEESLLDSLMEFLRVLDNEYGVERDVDHDDGGYVLFCTRGTTALEMEKQFAFSSLSPGWVTCVGENPKYLAALYIPRDEYFVVLVAASADLPHEIVCYDQEQALRSGK